MLSVQENSFHRNKKQLSRNKWKSESKQMKMSTAYVVFKGDTGSKYTNLVIQYTILYI